MAEEVGVSSQARAADEELRLLGTPAVDVADGAPKSARRRRSRGLGAALVGAGALAFAALTGRAASGSRAIGAALSRLTSITDNGDDAGSWGPADGDDDIALFLNQSTTASNGTADDDEFGASADLDFEVHNDYTELTRKPIGEKYPWLARYKLAEPYRTCKIILTGSLATDESKSLSVMWMINGAKHSGREVQYTFNSTGHFHVRVRAGAPAVSLRDPPFLFPSSPTTGASVFSRRRFLQKGLAACVTCGARDLRVAGVRWRGGRTTLIPPP